MTSEHGQQCQSHRDEQIVVKKEEEASLGGWVRDLTQDGIEPNPGPSYDDTDQITEAEIYSPGGNTFLLRVPTQPSVHHVLRKLILVNKLLAPPAGQDWIALSSSTGSYVSQEDSVLAGRYRLSAARTANLVMVRRWDTVASKLMRLVRYSFDHVQQQIRREFEVQPGEHIKLYYCLDMANPVQAKGQISQANLSRPTLEAGSFHLQLEVFIWDHCLLVSQD